MLTGKPKKHMEFIELLLLYRRNILTDDVANIFYSLRIKFDTKLDIAHEILISHTTRFNLFLIFLSAPFTY